ncbi:phage tail protein [Vibrio furnissii]|uniref:phage tail protein n=1 Tax=Vibrio furnissii TaxID=29494 RepID=UPI001EEBBD94|nr:phage tail protein [Vibrio furnissii]MCG6268308.1 phage tail protein [Vibrio furnissii]
MSQASLDRQIQLAKNRLAAISTQAVPVATSRAINQMGLAIERQTARDVAKEENTPMKVIRARIRALRKASAKDPRRRIRVRLRDLPAVMLGKPRQNRRGVTVRRRRFDGAFVADGSKGFGKYRRRSGRRRASYQATSLSRQQIFQRTGKERYPLEVVTVPIEKPLTRHFERNVRLIYNTQYAPELAKQLSRELRKITRSIG